MGSESDRLMRLRAISCCQYKRTFAKVASEQASSRGPVDENSQRCSVLYGFVTTWSPRAVRLETQFDQDARPVRSQENFQTIFDEFQSYFINSFISAITCFGRAAACHFVTPSRLLSWPKNYTFEMAQQSDKVHSLKIQISSLESQLQVLKTELSRLDLHSGATADGAGRRNKAFAPDTEDLCHVRAANGQKPTCLSLHEYSRYGRQMIVPKIGLEGD